jgi:hypothetical protein
MSYNISGHSFFIHKEPKRGISVQFLCEAVSSRMPLFDKEKK